MHLLAAQAGILQQEGEAHSMAPKSGRRFSDKAMRKKTMAKLKNKCTF